jgi:hypothetical protein
MRNVILGALVLLGAGAMLESNVATPTFVNDFVFGARSIGAGTASPGRGFRSIQASGGSITEHNVLVSKAQEHATAAASSSANLVMQMARLRDWSTSRSGTATFPGDVYFKSGAPWYDVKAYGAKCDGVTDDTRAITSAYTQLVNDLAANGGNSSGGLVYFPRSSGPCKVTTLTIPSNNKGWIVSVFDNGLLANMIFPSTNNAFIGRSGNFQGLSGVFLRGPNATWVQNSGQSAALVDLLGASQVYFEGLNIESAGANAAVHMHDNAGTGSVYVFFHHSMVESAGTGMALVVDSSASNQVAGFGLFAENTTFRGGGGSGPGHYTISITNFGQVEIEHSTMAGPGIYIKNAGIPSDGDIVLNDILSEALNNQDFLTIDGTYVNDITLKDIKLADTTGPVYMFKSLTANGGPVSFEMAVTANIGSGLKNPSSIPFTGYCYGSGCPSDGSIPVSMLQTGNPASMVLAQPGSHLQLDALQILGDIGTLPGIGLNAVQGVEFGDNVGRGYSSRLQQTAKESLGISVAQAMPPPRIGAAAQAGAGLANGTYYYSVSTYVTSGTCNGTATVPSEEVKAITTTGNDQVLLSWTPAIGVNIAGYCVFRGRAPNYNPAVYYQIAGAGTSSYTDTDATPTGGSGVISSYNRTFPASPQFNFTLTGLGIGTTGPAYSLDVNGSARAAAYLTAANCASSASPALCRSAAAGSVVVAASSTSVVVQTTAVTANSQIILTFDSSLGTKLGVTCNTTFDQGYITARTPGTSFTITASPPPTNPACFSYEIVN